MFKTISTKIKGRILYYPGCYTSYFLPDIEENYKKILTKIGVDFFTLNFLPCCGKVALDAGYKEQADNLLDENLEWFKKYKISKIITNCESCYKMLSSLPLLKVEHITKTIWDNIERLGLKSLNEEICYQDPCVLARDGKIYEEPRLILKALDFKIVEFKHNKEDTRCCGAGGLLKFNAPKIANKIAKQRLKEAKHKVITCSPLCYSHLKENSSQEIIELSEVLL